MHQYKNRKHAFEKEVTWILQNDELQLHSEGVVKKTFPLKQIQSIRLSYIPSRMRLENYACVIKSIKGEDEFTSTQFISVANFENTGKLYTEFVKVLVEEVTKAQPSVALLSGNSALSYNANNGLLLLAFALLAITIYIVGNEYSTSNWIKYIVIVAMLPYLIRYMIQNKPGKFSAHNIPEKLLPTD